MGKSMQVRVKRASEPTAAADGRRMLGDRLRPRGISRERQARTWPRDAAPSTEPRDWFDHRPKCLAGFITRYRVELDANPAALGQLRPLARRGTPTLMYGARDERHDEAVVLRDCLLGQAAAA